MKRTDIRKLVMSAMFLTIAIVLPRLFLADPVLGQRILPMHLPVLLCGLICGYEYGAMVGLLSPILALMINGKPMPNMALGMTLELCIYGFISGVLFIILSKKLPFLASVFISLICAMFAGRLVYSFIASNINLLALSEKGFLFTLWNNITTGIIGITVQIILIPIIMAALKKTRLIMSLN